MVGEFLKKKIQKGADLSIVSAYFTIYAFEALKEQLTGINHLNFLFGEPGFIRSLDPDKTAKKFFRIVDEHLELAKRLKQKQVAKEYAEHNKNAMSCDRTLLSILRLLKWRVNEIRVFYYRFFKTKGLANVQR